nr:TetR/AcrR family transcriptional regulator [Cellulomonas sp. APG4]
MGAARTLFARQGLIRTTLADIATQAGIARGLIYHYFPDKDALVDAVLAGYVADFVASLRAWDAAREPGNIDKALADCIVLFRRYLHPDGDLAPGLPRIEDARVQTRFVDSAVDAVVETLGVTTVPAYAAAHRIAIDHVPQTFRVLIHGLIALVRTEPDLPEQVLADIVRQTLRLDPSSSPADPEGA